MSNELTTIVTPYLKGGLGNRMFVVATTLSFAWKNGYTPVFRHKSDELNLHNGRTYTDTIFQHLPYNDSLQLTKYILFEEDPETICNNFLIKVPNGTMIMLKGFFQSPKLFEFEREQILNLFTYNHSIIDKFIGKTRTDFPGATLIGIHVRRGDYAEIGWSLPLKYYINAMDFMKKKFSNNLDKNAMHFDHKLLGSIENKEFSINRNIKYVIFTDDREWVQQNFSDECLISPILEDDLNMMVMSKMDAYIIANSTFSWWAAYLGDRSKSKIVLAPDPWNKKVVEITSLAQDHWIKIKY